MKLNNYATINKQELQKFNHTTSSTKTTNNNHFENVLYSNTPFKNPNLIYFGRDIIKRKEIKTPEELQKNSYVNIEKISTDFDTKQVTEKLIKLLKDTASINPYDCAFGYQGLDEANKDAYKKLLYLVEKDEVSPYALRGWDESSFDKKYIKNINIYHDALKNGLNNSQIADLFIPTFENIEQGLNKTKTGRIFETEGNLYYKTINSDIQKLDLSKETFFKLFNPIEPTCQAFASDCWILSAISSMLQDKEGRNKLFSCFHEKNGEIEVKLPNSKTSITTNLSGDLPEDKQKFQDQYVKGSKGVRLLVLALEKELTYKKTQELIIRTQSMLDSYGDDLPQEWQKKYNEILDSCRKNPTNPKYVLYSYTDKEKDLIDKGDFPQCFAYWPKEKIGIYSLEELQQTDFEKTDLFTQSPEIFYRANSGCALEAYRLLGQKVLDDTIDNYSSKYGTIINRYTLNLFSQSDEYFITNATTKDKNPEKGIFQRHDYALKIKKDPKTNEVNYILKNPHNTSRNIVLNEDDFQKYFDVFYGMYKKAN